MIAELFQQPAHHMPHDRQLELNPSIFRDCNNLTPIEVGCFTHKEYVDPWTPQDKDTGHTRSRGRYYVRFDMTRHDKTGPRKTELTCSGPVDPAGQ